MIKRFKLMPNAHAEEGANELFKITQDMVN